MKLATWSRNILSISLSSKKLVCGHIWVICQVERKFKWRSTLLDIHVENNIIFLSLVNLFPSFPFTAFFSCSTCHITNLHPFSICVIPLMSLDFPLVSNEFCLSALGSWSQQGFWARQLIRINFSQI